MAIALRAGWQLLTSRVGLAVMLCVGLWALHGVRQKRILLNPESWDLVSMQMDSEVPCQFIKSRIGARYDYAGLVLSQVLAFGGHNPDKWFCSEVCAAALGLPNPQRVSPQFLFDVVTWERKGVRAVV